ncbi:hypothetical protein Leryth_008823 [Lithospermum erythrorhizon]|nr:hypothetical protein Leryth_008823 [Lithospermum erythrorhizon]
MAKEEQDYPLIEFIHYHEEKAFAYNHKEKFGFPLVARISDFSQGSEIRNLFLKLLSPFLLPQEESSYNHGEEQTYKKEAEMEELSPEDEIELLVDSDFQFVLDNKHYISKSEPIKMDEPVPISKGCRIAKVLVYWSPKIIENYDTALLSHLPQVYRPTFPLRRVESISLDKCLDAFLKEEPLGPEDMWYCPNCKKHQQASKKLDIWRLPEILVIHLKRFSYNRYFKNKLETFVDFPIDDFDLSSYLIKSDTFCHHYSLYAVSNHYGGLGGGHYTAFAQHKHKMWYEFDDHRVFAVNEDQIRTSAAYVLFYRRV